MFFGGKWIVPFWLAGRRHALICALACRMGVERRGAYGTSTSEQSGLTFARMQQQSNKGRLVGSSQYQKVESLSCSNAIYSKISIKLPSLSLSTCVSDRVGARPKLIYLMHFGSFVGYYVSLLFIVLLYLHAV